MKFIKAVQFLLIFIFANNVGLSQDLYYEQFTVTDGLPSLMTYEMVQDSNNILWVGTENGLVSFDGDNFQRYSHPDLVDNDIIEISLDRFGHIYFINLSGQLGVVKSGNIEIINIDTIGGNVKNVISTANKNYLFVRIIQKNKNIPQFYEFFQNELGQYCYEISNKNYFALNDNKNVGFNLSPVNSSYYSDSLQLIKYPIGQKSRTYKSLENRCYHFNVNKNFVEIDCEFSNSLDQSSFEQMVNSGGKNFVFLDKGIKIFDLASKKTYTILKNRTINTVFIDNEKNVWCSSANDGLIKIPYIDLQLESLEIDFVVDYGVNDIIRDDYGNFYIGTIEGRIMIFSKKKKLIKEIKVSKSSKPIFFQKNENEIYGYVTNNLFKINPDNEVIDIDIINQKPLSIKSIFIDKDTVYLGNRSGLFIFRYNEYEKQILGKPNGLNGHWINTIYKDEKNNAIYLGTTTGLYKKEKSTAITAIKNKILRSCSISSIIGGMDNSIWVGTRNLGAIRIKEDSIIERFDKSNGLVSNNVNRLKIVNDQLLVSTVEGASIKNITTNAVNNITELSGVISKEFFVCDIIDGEYWLGSNSGLSIIKPNQLSNFEKKGPKLSIKDFYANGVNVDYEENIEFPHNINTILINLRNISLQQRKNKSIKYRINSIDSTWIHSSDPLIRLQSLKYGQYRIEAIGLNSKKEEGNKVELTFTINPPWWQTWWARIIGLLLLFSGIQIIYGVRTKRIRKEEETKRDYLTQINTIKDQALQLQMNPHFIFNSLNAIQGFIGTDEEEMAMNYLARFARLIRLIFEHSKGNTISLEEELEFINLYLDLEKLRFKDKVNIEVTIDPEVENAKDIINVPPLLIQPIVENSFKHGLFHKKGKGNLSINYMLYNDILQVIIQDNGIGRVESKRISQHNIEKQTSSGIKTTLERIDLLNFGKDKKLNGVEIEDLYDDNGIALGTKTILKLAI